MKQIKFIKSILFTPLVLVLLAGCSETDNYYSTLKKQPELIQDYDAVYAVNDTMTIEGHFVTDCK